MLVTTPSSGACDQAPMRLERLWPEVRRDGLEATGWLSQHELPPGSGCCSQEGWPWGLSQGSGAIIEGGQWLRQPPPTQVSSGPSSICLSDSSPQPASMTSHHKSRFIRAKLLFSVLSHFTTHTLPPPQDELCLQHPNIFPPPVSAQAVSSVQGKDNNSSHSTVG